MKCPKCSAKVYPTFDPVSHDLAGLKCSGCDSSWSSGRVERIYEDLRAHTLNQLYKIVDHLDVSDDTVEKRV